MRPTARFLAAVALATVPFTACGEDDKPIRAAQPTTSVAPTTTSPPSPIVVKEFTFSGLEVRAGSKLVVQNEGEAPHTLTAEDGSFDTGRIEPGKNAPFTVPSFAGTYKVKCSVHPSRMTGDLKVT